MIQQAARAAVVVLPIAAVEQHGPHLGVGTDTLLVTAIANAAEQLRPSDILLCPTQSYGSSHHHRGFPGTITISPRLYVDVLVELVESILGWGATRIVLLNGHGGNITPGKQAMSILSARGHQHANLAVATYWELAGKPFRGEPPMESGNLTHACEYETSMMLAVRPEAVEMARARVPKKAEKNEYVGYYDDQPSRGVTMSWPFHHLTDVGNMGRPDLATAAKGTHLVAAAADAFARFIDWYKIATPLKDLRP